jgi:phosphoribosyl-AMP cyclohydrolase
MTWLDDVKWDENGLVPVIAQEDSTGDVLMFAWMNREALARTAETGEAVYWSRSRKRLWHSCFFQKYDNGAWVTVEPVLKDPKSIYS